MTTCEKQKFKESHVRIDERYPVKKENRMGEVKSIKDRKNVLGELLPGTCCSISKIP